jgi:L-fuculose-phosphate aldolase
MDALEIARQDLIDAGMVLEHRGHGDMTRGHVAIRVPGRPEHFIMKPHGVGFSEITHGNILTFDLDGEIVAGDGRPHSERFIQCEIFRARPDVAAVIHGHPPHAVAFTATGQKLRPLSQAAATFYNALPVYRDTIQLIRSPETGRGLAACLGPHRAVLMRAHGVVVAGGSLAEAVVLCVQLEEAARIQLLAMAAGMDDWEFPTQDVEPLQRNVLRPDQFGVNFAFLVRQARHALGRTAS